MERSLDSRGFTLIELMITVVIIGLLAAMAIPNFVRMKANSIDSSMKSDLRNAFMEIEDYRIMNDGILPASAAILQTNTGLRLSPGVMWERYVPEVKNGTPSIHMHLTHPQSPRNWHAHYPAEGTTIEER